MSPQARTALLTRVPGPDGLANRRPGGRSTGRPPGYFQEDGAGTEPADEPWMTMAFL